MLSDDELMMELARRYRLDALRLRGLIAATRNSDWANVASILYGNPLDDDLPLTLAHLLQNFQRFLTSIHIPGGVYDPRRYADEYHVTMPGHDLNKSELDVEAMLRDARQWAADNPDAKRVERYLQLRAEASHDPKRAASEHAKIAKELGLKPAPTRNSVPGR